MEKRGQAAMEFLMTYGWAILAAVIAIGVLAYFGVFSPGKLMPDICTMSAPLGCDESSVTATSGVRLILRNGAGSSITINSISVSGCNNTTAVGFGSVVNGATLDTTITCVPVLVEDAKFSGDITIEYGKAGATINQTATGRISRQVAA